jgi:23S rRNA pseudouridine1911/1915/1917 synthase
MHQIRIQAAGRGWPVVGDTLYGSQQTLGSETDTPRDRPIALHARGLTFLHPIRYEPLTLTAPPPPFWAGLGFMENGGENRAQPT